MPFDDLVPVQQEGLNITRETVCTATGDLDVSLCGDTTETWYIPGRSPTRSSGVFRTILIDAETGLRACRPIPGRTEERVWEFWPSDLRAPENKQKQVDALSDFAGHGVHYSWEGTLLCDPIARLYELTGKKKYLDWSKWVVSNIDKWSGWDAFSRLDSVADGTLGVDKLQPYVHSHTFQMNFMGFLRLYRITGDKSLFRKVAGAWDDIHKRQMYITGGVSVAEHYEHDYVKPVSGHVVETCATMSWMQLTQMLLELTQAANNLDEAQLESTIAERSLQQAEENMRVSRSQYDVGLETLSDHLEAQAMWQQAYETHVDARFRLYLNYVAYLKATGTLLK